MTLVLSVALGRRRVLLWRTTILVVLVLIVVLRSTVRRIVTGRSTTIRLLVLRRIARTSVSGLLSVARALAISSLLRRRRVLVVPASAVPSLAVA
jgi:hypothetical protein